MNDVVKEMAAQREASAERSMTIPEAIAAAEWHRSMPEAILDTGRAKLIIGTLLSALEASPCYFKASKLGERTFTIRPHDRAGHDAMFHWANLAEEHGCRPEKVDEVRRLANEWSNAPGTRWPD